MEKFPVSNQKSEYATVLDRIRAYQSTGHRLTWWMHQQRADLRSNSAWRLVFEHVVAAHTDQVVAGLFTSKVTA